MAEITREPCSRLCTVCERKDRPSDAMACNALVQSWPEIARLSGQVGKTKAEQGGLFAETGE
jgi:putative DNA methylase